MVAAADPPDVLRSYVGRYLEQEVKAEGWVRQLGSFSRFLEAISFSHASILNLSAVSRDAQVEQKTTAGYLSVLEDLLLGYRVPAFTKRAKRATAVHPKFYYVDAGICRSVRPKGPLDRPEEIGGPGLEGLVAQHLVAWIAYSGAEAKLYHWRTRGGAEVDLVVYGEAGFWAIEVKVYRGNRARIGEIHCEPVDAEALLHPNDPAGRAQSVSEWSMSTG